MKINPQNEDERVDIGSNQSDSRRTQPSISPSLEGRRYLLTGASRGLGYLALVELIDRGAEVIAVARDELRLDELQRELGERVISCPLDLSEPTRVSEWASSLHDRFGALDGVIHNAGVDNFLPMSSMSADEITRQVHLNLLAPLLINRALIPDFISTPQERVVVHMSSVSGLVPTPFGSVYSATKAGLMSYNEALAIELHNQPIRFISLHPGFVHGTGMHEAHKAVAGEAPISLGGTTDHKVIQALLKALDNGVGSRVINRFPIRPLATLFILFPRLARALSRKITYPYLSRVAHARAHLSPSNDPERS